ncbi:hypothetical protein VHEMI09769 [[Torrubiella] hemipterigena]|uniref:Uncharacterized protein n=1 Tax=[Torrubiella] hemipterigena TaxID=1531966 RepID=A0A0A1TH63_9HYPO|nr:hypothetical protein VHEMI09769 [[Torrubiella] hemipterigena]
MSSRTRSGGKAPPPSIVYQQPPKLQQLQFPARRRRVRDPDTSNEPPPSSSTKRLRQQTLIQFTSSVLPDNGEHPSSDTEGDQYGEQDEESIHKASVEGTDTSGEAGQQDNTESEDEGPITRVRKRNSRLANKDDSTKRRRTLGDEASNQRKVVNKSSTSSLEKSPTRVDTHCPIVADSDDDNSLDGDPPQDFLQWLGDSSSHAGSPANISTRVTESQAETEAEDGHDHAAKQREDSVIPQTPVKNTRFQLPISAQLTTPSTARVARYGYPGSTESPSKLTKNSTPTVRRDSLIQDSYATDSWSSPPAATPMSSKSQGLAFTTPIGVASPSPEIRRKIPAAMLPQDPTSDLTEQSSPQLQACSSAVKPPNHGIYEIPDSDEEDGYSDFGQDLPRPDLTEEEPTLPVVSKQYHQSADDQEQKREKLITNDDVFDTGNETQLILDQLANSTSQWGKSSAKSCKTLIQAPSSPSETPFSSAREQQPAPTQHSRKRLRWPIVHPPLEGTQGLPLESQRVAVSILHTFSPTSPRSDILLPLQDNAFNDLLGGFTLSISLPFKIPDSVARAWLFNSKTTRYVADITTRPASPDPAGTWVYNVDQIYELNNPTSEDDMRAEDWIYGQIGRYVYFPPAVVSQLLYNLRHPVFSTEDAGVMQSSNVSTPRPDRVKSLVEAISEIKSAAGGHAANSEAIQSTLEDGNAVPGSQSGGAVETTPSVVPASDVQSSTIHPNASQTSTSSQLSTLDVLTCPEPLPSQDGEVQEGAHSSDSVRFLNHSSSIAVPFSILGSSMPLDASYQLLTKSQMLPDSLLRDDQTMPDEIWDSDDISS